ncbi:MAG: hypothetical protein H6Q41_759 [Deltaproteobacteria bacterium]|nr:hypothetical protein [Deltaproteobacteria bacterium]
MIRDSLEPSLFVNQIGLTDGPENSFLCQLTGIKCSHPEIPEQKRISEGLE